MDSRRRVMEHAFALEVDALVRCGQARTDALYDHALKEAEQTADGFAAAMERADKAAHEAIDASL
jgi:hypothetical protein